MNRKLIFSLSAAVLLVGAGIALSQSYPGPTVSTIHNGSTGTADLISIIPYGVGVVNNVYVSPQQITVTKGYAKNQANNGLYYQYTFGNSQSVMDFSSGTTATYAYVTMAPSPSDRTEACLYGIAAITTLYLNANTGQTINNAITSTSSNVRYCYLYGLSNAAWDRVQ